MPEVFPVPAVCGGAIETLIENVINENEKNPLFEITVCSVKHKGAVKEVEKRKYRYTSFLWTTPKSLISRLINIGYSVFHKIFRCHFVLLRKHYGTIYTYLKTHKFDYIIIEGGDIKCASEMLRCVEGKKVLHIHSQIEALNDKRLTYDYVIGVSDFITNDCIRHCSKELKGYTLKNCIDLSKFQNTLSNIEKKEIRHELSFDDNDFIIVYVGRIIPEKGVKELVKSVLCISETNIKLMIIGSTNFSSDEISEYESEIKSYSTKYPDRIHCVGYIPNDELYRYLSIADVQCVPSMWNEAAGLVVLEAMAMGIPTIVTQSGGMVEYVTDKTSVIVDRENIVDDLIKAIKKIKNESSYREMMIIESENNIKKYDSKEYLLGLYNIILDIDKGR